MALTWIDWLFVAVLVVTGLAGFVRGLIREALGLATWIIALLVARLLAPPVADLFSGVIDNPDGRLVLAFVLVIFAVILLGGFVIRLMHAAVEWVGMGLANRLTGAAFGLAKGGAMLVLATILLGLTPLAQLQAWQQAELRPPFEQLRDWALRHLEEWEGRIPEAPTSLREFSLPRPERPSVIDTHPAGQDATESIRP
ncbi:MULTISPECIES: CvpA family protein [Halomonas]|uniref:Membrane protein required for colicin V production n=1 Tax=Halomonas ventosae TaxID=229007 RepID=A0A4R6I3V9_9GAMM|nr:CvpA family protein [Halomonas ventosae]TDO16683.1 membrane protein required for colicin V production [Halomonas ventosae]